MQGTYHSSRNEGPSRRRPTVAEVVVHGGDEQRHSSTGAGTDDGLRSERRRDVARERVDQVRVGGEVDDDHCE